MFWILGPPLWPIFGHVLSPGSLPSPDGKQMFEGEAGPLETGEGGAPKVSICIEMLPSQRKQLSLCPKGGAAIVPISQMRTLRLGWGRRSW